MNQELSFTEASQIQRSLVLRRKDHEYLIDSLRIDLMDLSRLTDSVSGKEKLLQGLNVADLCTGASATSCYEQVDQLRKHFQMHTRPNEQPFHQKYPQAKLELNERDSDIGRLEMQLANMELQIGQDEAILRESESCNQTIHLYSEHLAQLIRSEKSNKEGVSANQASNHEKVFQLLASLGQQRNGNRNYLVQFKQIVGKLESDILDLARLQTAREGQEGMRKRLLLEQTELVREREQVRKARKERMVKRDESAEEMLDERLERILTEQRQRESFYESLINKAVRSLKKAGSSANMKMIENVLSRDSS